jgi:twitching motility protein PilT
MLRWVVSQRLVPKMGGGRYALLEIMGANLRTQESIRLGESEGKSFYEIIEASQTFGWGTFDYSCLEAFKKNIIAEETALMYCSKRGVVTRGIDAIRKARGDATTNIADLRMSPAVEINRSTKPAPASLNLKMK